MLVSDYVVSSVSTAISADGVIGHASGLKIRLVKAEFDPFDGAIAVADLTQPVTAGLAQITSGTGTQLESIDPDTGEIIIEIKPPVGGFRFETTAVPASTETVLGYAVLNNAGDTVLGSALFEEPVEFSAINQAHTIGVIQFRIPMRGIEADVAKCIPAPAFWDRVVAAVNNAAAVGATGDMDLQFITNDFEEDSINSVAGLTFPEIEEFNSAVTASDLGLLVSRDPATGGVVVEWATPLNGWYRESTETPAEPFNIYGWVLMRGADKVMMHKYEEPIQISAIDQAISVGPINFMIPVAA